MTDQLPEDVYEAGAEAVTETSAEAVATATTSVLGRIARVGMYGTLGLMLTGAVITQAAPQALEPMADFLPESLLEAVVLPARSGGT